MSHRRGRWCVMAIALVLATGPLYAQDNAPTIPIGVANASSALNDSQKSSIDQYINYWIAELTKGDNLEISAARGELIRPFGMAGASDIFLTAYSSSMAQKLIGALQSPNMQVRLNTMIVVGNLTEQTVVEMIRIGLSDKSPSVRYRAAKAAADVGAADEKRAANQKKLNMNQRKALFEVLAAALRVERDHYVIEQLLLALLGLMEMDEARGLLVTTLNERVQAHAAIPNLSLKPEIDAATKLMRRVVGQKDEASVRQLLPLAARWYSLCQGILKSGRANAAADMQYRDLLKICEKILRYCVGQLAPELLPRAPREEVDVAELLKGNQLDMLALRDGEWRTLLEQSPIGLNGNQLRVTIPEPSQQPTN